MPDPKNHRLDISQVGNPNMITEESHALLEQLIRERSFSAGELSFLSLSAKRNQAGGLEITLIATNGTDEDLVIKQLPLNFYDATGTLTAQGTFQLAEVKLQSNTSKPLTLVFPKEGILQDEMDLSSSTIKLATK